MNEAPVKKTHKKLNLKQIKFCQYYLTNGLLAGDAALKAGYSNKAVGYRLVHNPLVKNYIDEKVKIVTKIEGITFEWKVAKLKNIIELTEEKKPSVAISAIVELNKMQGDYAPSKNANLNVNLDLENDADIVKTQQLSTAIEMNRKDY